MIVGRTVALYICIINAANYAKYGFVYPITKYFCNIFNKIFSDGASSTVGVAEEKMFPKRSFGWKLF